MSWKEGFNAALLRFLQETLDRKDAVKVTSFDSTTQTRGVCDTCAYSTTVIEINYKNGKGTSCYAEWEGNMADLIRMLADD